MSARYLALLTNVGAAKLANATALGSRLNITQMAVGDGGGVLPTPNPAQTALINERRRAAINTLSVDPNNPNQIISEQVIPENEGGFWIREIGLFDDDGDLIAIANCPETYKPQLQEGSGRIQTVRMILIVSSTDAVTLKIDPAVVLATRVYVDSAIDTHEKSRKHPDGTLTAKGFVQLSNATNSDSETLAATPKAVKAANDNANSRLPSGGTAVAATKLAAARTIGGVAFDGTANINLPGVNTPGNQNTAGNAATATKLATARKIAGVEFDGTADIALNAAGVGALAKDQNGADILDKTQFRQNIGLLNNVVFSGSVTVDALNAAIEIGSKNVANTPFLDFNSSGNSNDYDARIIADGGTNTSSGGSLRIYSNELFHNDAPIMKVGQYGFGGFGGKISMSDAEFLPFLRNPSNPTQIIRNDAINTIAKQYSPTLVMRAEDLWTAISVGVSPDSTVAYGGISMVTGNNDGTVTTKHELWTDKNLKAPFGASMNTGVLHDCNLIPPGQTALCSEHAANGPGFYGIVFSAYGHNSLYVMQIAKAYGGNQFSYRARNGDINQWTEWSHSWDSSNLKQPVTAVEIAGLPQLFPGAVAPAGWLKCNGQQFDTAQYPVLASRYPSGFLPDLRGEFVRGWDDGRGVDAGRALLSAQSDAIRNITGSLFYGYDADTVIKKANSSTSAMYYDTSEKLHDTDNYMSVVDSPTMNAWYPAKLDASRVVPTASENRPRNIAFNYIVRAA